LEAADRQRAKAHLATQQAAVAAVAVLLLSAVSSACLEAPQSLELRRLFCEVEKQMAAVKAKFEPGPSRNSRNSRNPCTSYAFENSKALFLSINLSLAPPYKTYKDNSFDVHRH